MKKLFLILFVLFTTTSLSAQIEVKAIDKYIEKSRQDWNVPGMAVAIVKDGEVVLSKGYGLKELGKTNEAEIL